MTVRFTGRSVLLLLVLFVFLVTGVDLSAQQTVSPFEGKKTHGIRPGGENKITVARRLISAREYQTAADLLELVYESDPNHSRVQHLLRN